MDPSITLSTPFLTSPREIAYSSTKTKDRKVLAKFKTFVKILAAYSSPQLQLRFLGDVKLIRSADQLVASFADLAALLDQTSHNIPSYLLQSRLDRPPVLWNTMHEVLATFGIPEPSATTAQRLAKQYFLECPLDCLKREDAWVWRFLPGHSAAFATTRASLK
ncbi:MAG: hypothetical protein OHK93_003830 [Ramalina farinacea]|uniref:Uncharacterized protein n=1 Tax=Ramalina farinacea TaxID=258253 RepID=A0AA43TNN0_9LECA|nr:hypothetical protein [Ramalina farinacea]